VLSHPGLKGLFAHVVHHGSGGRFRGDDYRSIVEPTVQHPLHGHGEVGDIDMNDRSFHD
jgi:hypothetical protein